ncbi:hypothetical protein N7452_009081 [Penicillium brevicompactum]|uniref:TLC domain-containing protein n=1 Tax=Penicillium brevicompactum TaxID=5074 RepID=A0A9W9Q7U0_PENBR|nr:hypothetical protein N7452_009081 [Penicillium brevicompactum]
MKEAEKNTFGLRHVGIFARVTSFLLILKPALMVAFANKNWFDPWSQGSDFSLGDMAFISVMITSAFHLYELIFDQSLKPLMVVHHLGSIFIIQGFLPVAIGLPKTKYLELNGALAMMNVALYWALLDAPLVVLAYIATVLRSTFIQGRTNIRKLFYVCFNAAALFTLIEIVAIVYLSLENWQQLSVLQRTIICSLQLLFTSAKARVCKSFYLAYIRQMDQLNNQGSRHVEAAKPE